MGSKFGRTYRLKVQTVDNSTIGIQLPFTVEFDITRNVLTSANVASLRIYNLSQVTRNKIRKNINDYGALRGVNFQAGYGDTLSLAFNGNITQAWSVREGVNFVTQIESFDGGYAFANAKTDSTFPTGTPNTAIVTSFFGDLSQNGVTPGAIGKSFTGAITRGNAYSGNTCDVIKEFTSGRFYIDNGKSYCLDDNECLLGQIAVIDANAGLLNTPVWEQSILNFDMLFEPRLQMSQLIQLTSVTEPILSGQYKVISLKHRGTISAAICGDAITSVGLYKPLGTQELSVVPTL